MKWAALFFCALAVLCGELLELARWPGLAFALEGLDVEPMAGWRVDLTNLVGAQASGLLVALLLGCAVAAVALFVAHFVTGARAALGGLVGVLGVGLASIVLSLSPDLMNDQRLALLVCGFLVLTAVLLAGVGLASSREALRDDSSSSVHDARSLGRATTTSGDGAQTTATTSLDSAQTAVATSLDGVQTTATTSLDSAQTAATTSLDSAQTAATTEVDGAQTTAATSLDGAQTTATTSLDGAQTAATSLDGAQTTATTSLDGAQTAATSLDGAQTTTTTSLAGARRTPRSLDGAMQGRVRLLHAAETKTHADQPARSSLASLAVGAMATIALLGVTTLDLGLLFAWPPEATEASLTPLVVAALVALAVVRAARVQVRPVAALALTGVSVVLFAPSFALARDVALLPQLHPAAPAAERLVRYVPVRRCRAALVRGPAVEFVGGELSFEGTRVRAEQLAPLLLEAHAPLVEETTTLPREARLPAHAPLVVHADETTTLPVLHEVLTAARAAGFSRVVFASFNFEPSGLRTRPWAHRHRCLIEARLGETGVAFASFADWPSFVRALDEADDVLSVVP